MLLINTRPTLRAKALSEGLRAQDIDVYELPLLDISLRIPSDMEYEYLNRLKQNYYDALVVVSPSAAHFGIQACIQKFGISFRPPCPIIAVGQATAQVFTEQVADNIQNKSYDEGSACTIFDNSPLVTWQVHCPKTANNESMMVMPELANLTSAHKVLIWRGQGGRRLLIDHLQAKDVTVDTIAWYERKPPVDTFEKFTALCQKLKDDTKPHYSYPHSNKLPDNNVCVLISSAEAFGHWQALLEQYKQAQSQSNLNGKTTPKLTDFSYLVLGERLESILIDATTLLTDLQTDTRLKSLRYARINNLQTEQVIAGLAHL